MMTLRPWHEFKLSIMGGRSVDPSDQPIKCDTASSVEVLLADGKLLSRKKLISLFRAKRVYSCAAISMLGRYLNDNSQTRSPWGVQVKRLTKICWHLSCFPMHPRLLRQGRFKPCFRPGYFLLQLSDCMMKTCMLLAGARVHEHW